MSDSTDTQTKRLVDSATLTRIVENGWYEELAGQRVDEVEVSADQLKHTFCKDTARGVVKRDYTVDDETAMSDTVRLAQPHTHGLKNARLVLDESQARFEYPVDGESEGDDEPDLWDVALTSEVRRILDVEDDLGVISGGDPKVFRTLHQNDPFSYLVISVSESDDAYEVERYLTDQLTYGDKHAVDTTECYDHPTLASEFEWSVKHPLSSPL